MIEIHCESCGKSKQLDSKYSAESEGWEDVSTDGVSGPFTDEVLGICPNCV